VNLGRAVPLVGGIIGATFDSTSTYAFGEIARMTFVGTASRTPEPATVL